jgi:hypothetical protein
MSRTWLLRTEPRTTASNLAQGIAARVYDPLWLLGRQWQLGEFLGEDAGSPVSAALDAQTAPVAVYRRGRKGKNEAYDPGALPLEAMVEADQVRGGSRPWTLRLRIDTGREFLRALDDAHMNGYAAAFREAYPLEPATVEERAADPGAARLLDVAAGRIPDGKQLYHQIGAALDGGLALPAPPTVAANDVDPVRKAAQAWLAWCRETLFETGHASAWQGDTLDYAFSVATSSGAHALSLDAGEYRGGSLDWHSFDVRPERAPADFKALPTLQGVPTGVRFRGMPNARWWEFEDASVDFGSIDAGASDTARLAVLEFGLVYANDFFAMPLRLAVGSLCRITSLVVADTFGMNLKIEPAGHGASRQGDRRWSMFTLSERDPAQRGASGVGDVFFLAPVAQQLLSDRPVEEVLLLRDEMANLAWAVERRYEGAQGIAAERLEETMRGRPPAAPPPGDPQLHYLLGTTVPDYWYPLVPVPAIADVRLELQRMANQPVSNVPRGSFLRFNAPSVADSAVPREGRQLSRDYVFTRWSSGASFVWSRRLSRVGRGEGSSGLRFDVGELG